MERSEANETRGTRQGEKRRRERGGGNNRGGGKWRSEALKRRPGGVSPFSSANSIRRTTDCHGQMLPPSSPLPASLSLFLSSTVKPMNQRVNTGLSPRKLQLQEGKQSRHSSGPSSDSSLALQNIIFILKLQCRTFHLCDILFSAIHYSSSIICEPATGIPQLPLAERRIREIPRQLFFLPGAAERNTQKSSGVNYKGWKETKCVHSQ